MRVSTFPRIERISRSGSQRRELRRSPQAARADDRPGGQLLEGACSARDEAVADVLSRGDGADRDAGRVLRRKVLERVHGDVDLAVAKRALELGGEKALAADRGQRLPGVLRPVAGSRDHA